MSFFLPSEEVMQANRDTRDEESIRLVFMNEAVKPNPRVSPSYVSFQTFNTKSSGRMPIQLAGTQHTVEQ